jgi:hypothetical protein
MSMRNPPPASIPRTRRRLFARSGSAAGNFVSSAAACGALVVGVLLAGCDNAVVNVTDSGWKPLAMNTAQLPPSSKLPTTPVAQGTGAVVNGGDLVKLRLPSGYVRQDGSVVYNDAWYWTGTLPEAYSHYGATRPTELGSLLVGRRVGEQFLLEPQDQGPYLPRVTLTGMPPPQPNRKGFGQVTAFQESSSNWSLYALRKSSFEIIAACPVKLSVRKGEMTQWGYVLNLFGADYPARRRGTLYWSAIDADCPAPDGHVRFMIGPIYVSATSGVDQEAYRNETLLNFYDAYSAKRPRSTYPDEYQHMVIGDRWIRVESPRMHAEDAAVPLVHGPPPPGFGRYIDPAPPKSPDEPRNDKVEGYAWAMDNNIETVDECNAGTPDFIAGCRSAVVNKAGGTAK